MPKPRQTQQAPSSSILAIESSWDSATKTLFAYREKHLYTRLKKTGWDLTILSGKMARRVFFEAEAAKDGIRLIIGMGHGDYDHFTGHLGEVVLEVGKYDAAIVRGRIIHLLSCRTAGKLGPDLIASGATAFFGYSGAFTFLFGYESVFFECVSEVDRALAEGANAATVHARTSEAFDRQIDLLASRSGLAAAILTGDWEYFCSPATNSRFGNEKASL